MYCITIATGCPCPVERENVNSGKVTLAYHTLEYKQRCEFRMPSYVTIRRASEALGDSELVQEVNE